MFKSISIKNFRGIKELDIKDLKNINVLVGDNATGKTTILDAIYILINPGNPGLPLKTNEWRNLSPLTPSYWKSLFFGFNHKNTIELSARGENSRNVTIKPTVSDSTTFSATEQSNGEAKPSSEIKQTLNGLELSFKIGKGKHQSTVEQTSIDFAKLNPSKDYKATLQGNYFNNKTYAGELDLSNKFDAVNQEVGKEEIISFLKKFKEGIEDVELDSYRKLLVKDSSFGNKRVHLNTYGDGVVRGLHMLLDILFKQDGLTLIDEVENGLHWSKQETIWQFIHQFVKNRNQQLFVTTHSKEMIVHLYELAEKEKFTNLIKVYRLQNVGGEIKIVPYNKEQLAFAISHDEEFR